MQLAFLTCFYPKNCIFEKNHFFKNSPDNQALMALGFVPHTLYYTILYFLEKGVNARFSFFGEKLKYPLQFPSLPDKKS